MSTPATMRQYRLPAQGSIENLEMVSDAPVPRPGPGEVLVHVAAVSLNARDLMIVLGPLEHGRRPNMVPVSDGAGTIVATGEGVTDLPIGTRVVASFRQQWLDGEPQEAWRASDLGGPLDGLLSDYAVLPATGIVPVPERVPMRVAATLPCAAVTAWQALARPDWGKRIITVLVQGTGGVSLFALQLAKSLGGRVIAITSNAARAARLERLGADAVIDRSQCPAWEMEVRGMTGGRGVDHIIEVVGGANLERTFAVAAYNACIALVGQLGESAPVAVAPIARKRLTVQGISAGSRADLETVLSLVAEGRVAPVLDSVFPFDRARDAFRHLAEQRHCGKVVITMGPAA